MCMEHLRLRLLFNQKMPTTKPATLFSFKNVHYEISLKVFHTTHQPTVPMKQTWIGHMTPSHFGYWSLSKRGTEQVRKKKKIKAKK